MALPRRTDTTMSAEPRGYPSVGPSLRAAAGLLLAATLVACVEVVAPETPDAPSFDRTVTGWGGGWGIDGPAVLIHVDEWVTPPNVRPGRDAGRPYVTVDGSDFYRQTDTGLVPATRDDLERGQTVRIWLWRLASRDGTHATQVRILDDGS